MDALQSIQNKILKLEEQLTKARKSRDDWADKYHNDMKKIHKLEETQANQSELEHLRIENGKLRVKLVKLERNERALEKIRKIEQIIKG